MADRAYPRSGRRSIIDYNHLASVSDEYVIACLNRSVLAIARDLIRTRGLWPTTYAVNYGDDGYDIPDNTQMVLIEELISEFLGSTNQMNCDDFIAEMTRIADAVERSATANEHCCAPGSAGAGNTEAPAQTFNDDGSTTFPVGYADRADYETAKCAMAERLRLDLIADLNWIKDNFTISTVATIVAGALITPIPFDDILAVTLFVISLIAQGIMIATVDEVITYLTDNAQDIRCRLFESATATAALSEISDGSMSTLAETLLGYMVNLDMTNPLFEYDPTVGDYGVGNCSACDCDWIISVGTGTVQTDNTEFTVNAAPDGGNWKVDLNLLPLCCDDKWTLEVVGFTGSPTPNNGADIDCCPGPANCAGHSGGTLTIGSYPTCTNAFQVETSGGGWGVRFKIRLT